MMAVRSPFGSSPSTNGLISTFSPLSDYNASPRVTSAPVPSYTSALIHPERSSHLVAPSPNTSISGTEFIDPSPIAPSSNGTEFADVDEAVEQTEKAAVNAQSPARFKSPVAITTELKIETKNLKATPSHSRVRSDDDDPPQSVIHVPSGFGAFSQTEEGPRPQLTRQTTSPSQKSDITVKSPAITPDKAGEKKAESNFVSPPTLRTAITPPKDPSERQTPRAQTRQEIDVLEKRSRLSNLAGIPEGQDNEGPMDEVGDEQDHDQQASSYFRSAEDEIIALKTALTECWTLCNTLASLSYIHRERMFSSAGTGDMQEQAWKSCWRFCQQLYDSRDDDTTDPVRPTLDLCREFCQALFEVRVRDNEAADSVLRVSFELNNHLFNTHDRNLPEAFQERTLEFYITLCHRLMKQKSRLPEETDSLLMACWSLAEMLFSLRQSKRSGKKATESLLGSAIQACWELCDLFREGWTQIRPERGTPRPSQTTFTQAFLQAKRSGFAADDELGALRPFPETPTTIFEDTVTAALDEMPVPHILVFGQAEHRGREKKWSSASSTLSASSRNSDRTHSSAHTVTTPSEDPSLTLLKLLFVKAALNMGYQRGGSQNLPAFAKTLSDYSFGLQPWQVALLENYKKVVVSDPSFRNIGAPVRAGAVEVARAVQAMVMTGHYPWLKDLYRLVFGFYMEEAQSKKTVVVQT